MAEHTIEDVKSFWQNNPLFTGESSHEPGSKEFFEEHKEVYYDDVFAGEFEANRFLPDDLSESKCLDLGCGVGFWTIEIQKQRPAKSFYSADLTEAAIETTKQRLEIYELHSELSVQNAEQLQYEDNSFDFVNCQGVIHHTVNPENAFREIGRVLRPGGKASLSVYYKNFFLRNWKLLGFVGKILFKFGAKLKGRGRESIFNENDVNQITRLYDGDENPIGISYSKEELYDIVIRDFEIEKMFLYFFPARALPFNVPKSMHKFMAKYFGFMIHLNLVKK